MRGAGGAKWLPSFFNPSRIFLCNHHRWSIGSQRLPSNQNGDRLGGGEPLPYLNTPVVHTRCALMCVAFRASCKTVATWTVVRQSVTTPLQPVTREPRSLPALASLCIFRLAGRALILDQPGPLLDWKCFTLVKIIALSFPTRIIASAVRWGMYLLRQSLSRRNDGNCFN